MPEVDNDHLRWSAIDQLAALQRSEFSSVELLADVRERRAVVDPVINAVVATDFAAAEAAAEASDRRRAAGISPRPLEGLPVVVKDLEDTAGLRTTYGSTLHADHTPERDSLVVERLRAAGAIVYGKSNTPEFGTGSHTYNRVYGTTTNPYAPERSAGGSSGGAAAALAMGLSSVADGSDMGGSLRNPASFCNVVGLRPTAGRVPNWPVTDAWETLATNGPMGRTVDDTALLFSVLSGGDPRSPFAADAPVPAAIPDRTEGLRVGWSRTLGGLEIQPEITAVLDRDGRETLTALGHAVHDVEPPLADADRPFRVLRGLIYARSFGSLLEQHGDVLSPELVRNTEDGLRLTLEDYLSAREQRTRVYASMVDLFRGIDILAAPVSTVVPFPAEQIWPREVNGVAQADYLDWMRASWRVSLVGFPAISLPCGFTDDGLPIGVQLIAAPGREELLLSVARQFEQARPVWRERPRVLIEHSASSARQQETEGL